MGQLPHKWGCPFVSVSNCKFQIVNWKLQKLRQPQKLHSQFKIYNLQFTICNGAQRPPPRPTPIAPKIKQPSKHSHPIFIPNFASFLQLTKYNYHYAFEKDANVCIMQRGSSYVVSIQGLAPNVVLKQAALQVNLMSGGKIVGAIKDLIDLVTQLSNSVQDRKFAAELNAVQSLILKLQAEQATLHGENIQLREEKLSREERIQKLEAKISELSSAAVAGPANVPKCPNCSTSSKPFYMRPVATNFVLFLNATHECPQCKYRTTHKG